MQDDKTPDLRIEKDNQINSLRNKLSIGFLCLGIGGILTTGFFGFKSLINYSLSGGPNFFSSYYQKNPEGWGFVSGKPSVVEYDSIEDNPSLSRTDKNAQWKSLEDGSKLNEWANWYTNNSSIMGPANGDKLLFEDSYKNQKEAYSLALNRRYAVNNFVSATVSGSLTGLTIGLVSLLSYQRPKSSVNSKPA